MLILCYHSVALKDEDQWNGGLYCTEAFLRRRFEILRETDANVLGLDEALERLQAGGLPPRSVVLTFDDGTVDFPQIVVPLLEEFGYQATLYPSTYYCDRNQPVWTVALRYLLWKGRSVGSIDPSGILPNSEPMPIASPAGRTATGIEMMQGAAKWDTDAKHELVRTVARLVGVDFDEFMASRQFQLMSSQEMSQLPHDTVTVELHTHRHRTPDDQKEFIREIHENRTFITDRRGVVPRHFCYPSGTYRQRYFGWLADIDVLSATTCTPALVDSTANPYLTPRFVDTSMVSEKVFRAWVSGVASLAPRRPGTGVPSNT